MVGGNSEKDIEAKKASSRFGLPVDLVCESESFKPEEISIYPDNAEIVAVFDDMMTQWRVGMKGPIGLDYKVLPFLFDVHSIEQKKDTLDGLKVMEMAALKVLRETA